MDTFELPSGEFQYSGAEVENLQSSEYTVAHIAFDESSSTSGFSKDIDDCAKTIVDACSKNPRADNMMLSVNCFSNNVREFHGFKELRNCHLSDYHGMHKAGGMTALNDAALIGIESVGEYGKKLAEQGIMCNGIVFIVTDGAENNSSNHTRQVKESLEKIVMDENLESLTTVLIGVNTKHCRIYLEDFKNKCGITEYIEIENASKSSLAKLANFVSQSISSTSQSLGSGSNTSLTF